MADPFEDAAPAGWLHIVYTDFDGFRFYWDCECGESGISGVDALAENAREHTEPGDRILFFRRPLRGRIDEYKEVNYDGF